MSCNQEKVKRLEAINDSLVQQESMKEQSINEFLQAFNEIQYNLDSIKEREMIITEKTKGKTELKKSAKDQINYDINTIYQLLSDTKEKLANMKKRLGKANYQIAELEKLVDHLNKQIQQKDVEIETLRGELEKLNIKVVRLTQDVNNLKADNDVKNKIIEGQADELKMKTEELYTGYYVFGSKKFLKENKIITATGGFIGIGKTKKLKSDFNDENFTKIDIREITEFAIPGSKFKMVTDHPSDSYEILGEKESRVLHITNYERFWKSSRYLVIITE
jgi:DNA repair exonuclease SbcCD ATPase subunit